jgi:alkanesulfonate monooxygenase SsuD/methylene tetrahydromethanopterin reductase-like flavin-dependent oxidoreductase (luciferase family)
MWSDDDSPFQGRHVTMERPLNSPQALSRPHPPIMIGGGGEKKTLRFVAKYAQACNLFGGPDLAHKLDVLREHCEREGRNYDDIEKTVYHVFDVNAGVEQTIAALKGYADLGVHTALGAVRDVHTITPLETIGNDVIPAVAGF